MQSASAPNRRRAAGPATLGEFVLVNGRGARNRDEWMVILADLSIHAVAIAHIAFIDRRGGLPRFWCICGSSTETLSPLDRRRTGLNAQTPYFRAFPATRPCD